MEINKLKDAFDIAFSFVISDKEKNWSQDYEKIIIINLELAIKLKKQNMIIDILEKFRNISENHNKDSFLKVS